MHRDLVDRGCLAGMERGLNVMQFVAGLHERGLMPEEAADVVSQALGVGRGAARLYIRSHPAWAAEAPDEGPGAARGFFSRREDRPCS